MYGKRDKVSLKRIGVGLLLLVGVVYMTAAIVQELTKPAEELAVDESTVVEEPVDVSERTIGEGEIKPAMLKAIYDSYLYSRDGQTELFEGLGYCQAEKYAADHGQAALDELTDSKLEEMAAGSTTTIQEDMMAAGYSCSVQESLYYYDMYGS